MDDIQSPAMPDLIAETVSLYFGVSMDELRGRKRYHHIVEARSAAIYLIKEWTSLGILPISAYFCRDHSTTIHMLQRAEMRIKSDCAFKRALEDMEQLLENRQGACKRFQQTEQAFLQAPKTKFGYDEASEQRLLQRLELICRANRLADVLVPVNDEPEANESPALQKAVAWRKSVPDTSQPHKRGG